MPVTNVKTRWNEGNLQFLDSSGNVIFTFDGTNRAMDMPSGAVLDLNGTWKIGGVAVTATAAQINALSGGGTLDQAYDFGGAGLGRAITADSGAVTITDNAADNNNVLALTKNPSGAQSGAVLLITVGAQATGAGISFANTGSGADISGTSATWTISKAGVAVLVSLSSGAITLTEGTAPAGTLSYIVRDNTGDTTINALTGKQVHLAIANADVLNVAGTGVTITGTLETTGAVTIGGALAVTGAITVTGGMTFVSQIVANAGIDLNGQTLIMDADGGSSIDMATDNVLTVTLNTAAEYIFGTATLDLNSNALDNAGFLILNAATAPAATEVYLVNDNTGDLTANALSGKLINLAIAGTDEVRLSATALYPATDAGNALGIKDTNDWNGLYLATGTAISWENDDVTLTHASNALTLGGGDLLIANTFGLIVGHTAQVSVGGVLGEVEELGTAQADSTLTLAQFAAAATGPAVYFAKSRNAAIGSFTIVQDNDVLGTINAFADDGVDAVTESARIQLEVDDGTPAANSVGGAIVLYTAIGTGADDITERVRVNAAGDTLFANGGGVVIGHTAQVSVGAVIAEAQVLGTAQADSTLTLLQAAAAATGPGIYFTKSRNAAIAAFTIVADNDVLGTVNAFADDGVDYVTEPARIQFEVDDATPAANSIGGAIVFYTAIGAGADDITQKMAIGATATVVNETGIDQDFRIEGDNNANMLVIDAGTDSAAIGSAVVAGAALSISNVTARAVVSSVGVGLHMPAVTLSDTAATGTAAVWARVQLEVATLTATDGGGRTYTNAATLNIVGPPTASTNVTVTAGGLWALRVAAGNTLLSGDLYQTAAAVDHVLKAATAAAYEITDSTATKYVAIDTRATTDNVVMLSVTGVAPTVATSAAGSTYSIAKINAITLTFTARTADITALDGLGLYIGAPTVVGGAAITVGVVSNLYVKTPVQGANITYTLNYPINTEAGAFLTAAGVWTDKPSDIAIKGNVQDLSRETIMDLLGEIKPKSWEYTPDWATGERRYGIVAQDLPDWIRPMGTTDRGALSGSVIGSFALAALRALRDEVLALKQENSELKALKGGK